MSESQDQASPATADETEDVQHDEPHAPLELPHTGDEQVDQALERLVAVPELPSAEQVEVYVGVHRDLQDRLADLEE
ncbi:hypothetical protein [Angustibacter luteus]|uniref:Uncharacterized protein n=1 Tax=Angustibacter luteus TaxID=658456 RepID=A0ABW1J9Q7_9ACTN